MAKEFPALTDEQKRGTSEEPLNRLDVLSETERYMVLEGFNQTREQVAEASLPELFEEQVERTPEAAAVVCGEERLTYRELNRRANQLAHYLRDLGIRPEARVAICMKRSAGIVVAVLGVLKAGGAYVPLDPAYPQERLKYMLEDSGSTVLITQEHFATLFQSISSKLPVLNMTDTPVWAGKPDINLDHTALGLDGGYLAYVIYTSGSTGTPKGVQIQQRSITRLVLNTNYVELGPQDVIAQASNMSFDAATFEIWGALLTGACLLILGKEEILSLAAKKIAEHKVTVLFLTTALFNQLASDEPGAFAKLRYLLAGGEKVEPRWFDQVLSQARPQHLLHVYGPTETTTFATWQEVQVVEQGRTIPIGRPISNTQIFILDEVSEPVQVGVVGELYIGGIGLARGYLNRPEQTAERFVPNPYAKEAGERMYRTGDLGRWRPDGSIEFVGRNDFQVKVRGFRIELGEIEARLREYAGVREAAVVMREDTAGDKKLVAYYTCDGGIEGQTESKKEDQVAVETERKAVRVIGAEELRAYLTVKLPEHMVPAAYVRLDKLPLTANGKLDRKTLRAPAGDAYTAQMYKAPQSEMETTLARIWTEVLKLERVGRNDNFFDLGGHSLLAVRVVARMRQSGLKVDRNALFAMPTIAELAMAVVSQDPHIVVPPNLIPPECDAITPEMLPLLQLTTEEIEQIVKGVVGGAANVQDIYPLAPLQEGIFFHYLMAGESDPYVLALHLTFDHRKRLDGYIAAMQAVIDRHDILRTAVMWEGLREPVQVVWRKATVVVEEVEVDGAGGDVSQQLHERFNPRRNRIDVCQAPLLRLCVAEDREHGCWVMLQLLHHLVMDHSAMEILQVEIEAHMQGQAERLPVPQPFRNLIAEARHSGSKEEHEEYFRRLLGDVDEPTAPFGLLDVQGDGSGIQEAYQEVDAEIAGRIREQAREWKVSAASLCHLAWAVVLGQLTGREDVVFGTVLLGRMQGGVGGERGMGLFINTLPVRFQIGQQSVEAGVRQTHSQLADLLQHEHASLALAQRCSAIVAPAPLFTTLLNYRHSAAPAASSSEREVWVGIRVLFEEERTNYPFTLSVDDMEKGFALTAQVRGVMEPVRVCMLMCTALEALVEALERAPGRMVSGLNVLGKAERYQVLYEWNDTRGEIPEKCLPELFEEQVERRPEAVAVVDGEERLTYRELNQRANRLAHYLRSLGVGSEVRVAICMERSVGMVVAILGVLKAGGAYVPIDASYPAERLEWMLKDVQASILLTQSGVETQLAMYAGKIVRLDKNWKDIEGNSEDNPVNQVCGEDLAYVIYTSGSTGKPKGVAIQHRSLLNLIAWHIEKYQLTAADRTTQFASISFDAAVWEIWPALAVGASLWIVEKTARLNPVTLPQWLHAKEITLTFLPTGIAEEVMNVDWPAGSSLRHLLTGGDKLHRTFSSQPNTFLFTNHYGPTENTVVATASIVDNHGLLPGAPPIGKPIANTQIYIVDRHMEPVPVGVTGELYIAGMGLARGYLNRPEQTAERFVPNPYTQQRGERMYRTGDLGRWRPDGSIEYVGRNDWQVKVRGFRIEPGEIEAALQACPEVAQGVVVVREDIPGDKHLVGYVVAAQDKDVDGGVLRQRLLERLPEYMVPGAYVRLDKLPLTGNGKLDRKALPAPDEGAYRVRGYEAPVGEMEKTLAGIWAEVLRVERVGRHDNFFALGGHSLLAVRVIARLRQKLGVEIEIYDLFARPQLRDFVQAAARAGRSTLQTIPRAKRSEKLPLSFAQQRLWFVAQMEGGSEAHHVPLGLQLSGRLDSEALKRALDRIVARHEVLRTTFGVVDGEPFQRIGLVEESRFQLLEQDLRGHADRAEELERTMGEEALAGFDLHAGPLVRGRLIRMAEEEHVLLITMHHIVSDEWSMGVLFREMGALYGAYQRGEENPLPELEVQYADYALWQRKWMEGEGVREQEEYWKENLAGVGELLDLPADRVRPARQDYAGGMVGVKLDEKLTRGLKELSRRHGMTLYMTLLAMWGALLGRLSGEKEVVIGTPVANRGRVEVEELIGFFVNMLVMRVDLSGRPRVGELLARVKNQVLAGQQHQDAPFERVVEMIQPMRSLAHSPLFQVTFTWLSLPEEGLKLPELEVQPLQTLPYLVSKFDMSLILQESGGGIEGAVGYATALFDPQTVERFLGYYKMMLEGIAIGEADEVVNAIAVLNEKERRQVVHEWNHTEAMLPTECVHELFEQQSEKATEAVAVECRESALSYGELNRRANRLAHYLRRCGVDVETRVGVCLERSIEMVIAMLGILKAGGAYVPLDVEYPAERLEFMLADAEVGLVVTERRLRDYLPVEAMQYIPMVYVDGDGEEMDGESSENVGLGTNNSQLAYVMYTSGSMGWPKGVMVTHGNVVRLVRSTNYVPFGAGVVMGHVSNVVFDASTFEVWGGLLNGGRLVVIPKSDVLELEELSGLLKNRGVSTLFLTTALFQESVRRGRDIFEGIEQILFGGEVCDPECVERGVEEAGAHEVIHVYGPTESTTFATYAALRSVEKGKPVPIGRPIGNTIIHIVDEEIEAVGVGLPGEICIGGKGVARGYAREAGMTAERFVPNPFGDACGERMYRTGDNGRRRHGGVIEFIGRKDEQVKIRGYRIELGEVEVALRGQVGVQEAVVVAWAKESGDKQLVAYVVGKKGVELRGTEVREGVRKKLPEYMLPTILVLEELPLTANGKVDRRKLPRPEQAIAERQVEYAKPRNNMESRLAEVWAEALGLERVGIEENFFELGGDSILCVRVISRALERGLEFSVQDLFEHQTVAALAGVVRRHHGERIFTAPFELVAEEVRSQLGEDIEDAYPLSRLQVGMLFHSDYQPDSGVYHDVISYRLHLPYEAGKFQKAVGRLVQRHEMLRTSIDMASFSEPLQLVHRQVDLRIVEQDWRVRSAAEQEAQLAAFVYQECRTGFAWEQAPQFRLFVHLLSDGEFQCSFSFHHAIMDGWSEGSLITELVQDYKCRLAGEALEARPLAASYRDYIALEQRAIASQESSAFWKQILEAHTVTPVPLRDWCREGRAASLEEIPLRFIEIRRSTQDQLLHLAREMRTPLKTVLLAAHMKVLQVLSGQSDVTTGVVLNGRPEIEGGEQVIGLFLNTVPFRLRLGSRSWRSLIRETFAAEQQILPHRRYPMVDLRVQMGGESLFETVFNYVHFHVYQELAREEHDGRKIIAGRSGYARTNFHFSVSFEVSPNTGELSAMVQSDTAMMGSEALYRVAGYYERALAGMMEDRIGDLRPEEERQVMEEWNRTGVEVRCGALVHELFEEQVRRTPNAIAVVFEDQCLSYGELNRRANQLGHYLKELGVKPDDRVAISVERSLEMVVGILATLKAGAAYVPLDPIYPAERLLFMLADSVPAALLTQSSLRRLFPGVENRLHVLEIAAENPPWLRCPASNPHPSACPQNLAYVIYTSGSTGQPKGITSFHAAITNLLCDWTTRFRDKVSRDGVQAMFWTSFGFDVSVFELFAAFALAGTVNIVPEEIRGDSQALLAWLSARGITFGYLPPFFIREVQAGHLPASPLPLELVLVGVEPLAERALHQFRSNTPRLHIVNGYGPTETTVFSTIYEDIGDRSRNAPIGRPLGNTQIYILDEYLQPLPLGVMGELYIAGAGVARGYLNRPELTAERFVSDPFVAEASARMYKTGDLGRWLADGTIEFLGRNDFQVKVRGGRIELGEVEAGLQEHAEVSEAVVAVREDRVGDKTLVAYYTCGNGEGDPGAEQLRAHLGAKLPPYMVPAAFVRLERMPRTANGKLDRKALPAPDEEAYGVREYEAPVGEMEKTLAGIWAEVLKLERLGRHDNFFALGGHSLLAVRMIARMQQNGLKVKIQALFAMPTIAELAMAVVSQDPHIVVPPNLIPPECDAITPEMLPLLQLTTEEIEQIVKGVVGGAANVQDIYPLAPLQEGIFFHYLMAGESDPYVLALHLTFDHRKRLDGYIAAMQAVIDRHDILRTAVMWEGLREPVQVVWRKATVVVEEVEVDGAGGDVSQQLHERFNPRRNRIDVCQAPLLRLCVAEDREHGCWVMLQLLHHLVMDHSAMEILQVEIEAHMQGQAERLPVPQPFRNLVAEARHRGRKEEDEEYFRRLLGDVEEPTAPFGLLDVQGDGSGVEEASLTLDTDLARRIRAQVRRLKVSAASVYHLAWAQVLAKVTGRQDVVFGTVLFGRMQGGEGADRVMGLFINTLPIRIEAGEAGVEDSVRKTHQLLAELLEHEHAPLALAQRCSGVPAPAPLFSSLLNYRHSSGAGETLSAEAMQAWAGMEWLHGKEHTNYPFALAVDDMGEGFGLTAQTVASVGAERVCVYTRRALEGIVAALESAPQTAVRKIDILPGEERRRLLYEWNAAKAEYPREKCLHELFEEQAARSPEATAVIFKEQQLTYGELNRRANRLAHYLREVGVRPDERVAICTDRGLEMIIALLAVLKAGGAYVPLDPDYPVERLRYMLEESAPVVVLAQNDFLKNLLETNALVLSLDSNSLDSICNQKPETNPEHLRAFGFTGNRLAYVIYTSGSTGAAKGVMIEHRGLPNVVALQRSWLSLDSESCILQFASFSFDASMWDILMAFAFGCRLCVADSKVRRSVPDLIRLMKHHNVTHAALLPSLSSILRAEDLPALKFLVSTGEALNNDLMRYWAQNLRLFNGYGPTETTIGATFGECSLGLEKPHIGRPFPNTRVYILDGYGEPVPVGVTGELYIGGVQLARGYMEKPEMTAERFVPDGFVAEEEGARMYRTGDVGRWLKDGNIEFVGRNDEQVKIRGFRIELGEIEAALTRHQGVEEAVVVAREDNAGGKRLAAYYTAEAGVKVNAGQLRAYLKESLPEYMVPAAYVRLEKLPLTANGKIDRRALPAPDEDAYGVREYEAPVGEMEKMLADIWAEVLRVEQVGRHDNFFALGGHSLLAVRLVSRVRQMLSVELAIRTLFEAPTVAELTPSLRSAAPTRPSVARQARPQRVPLSYAQQRLWFLDQMGGQSTEYNMPEALHLRGDLDRAALERTVDALVERHESLRTRFAVVDGEPWQIIQAEMHIEVPLEDISGLEAAAQREAVMTALQREWEEPFDLAGGQVLRMRLLRLGQQEHILLRTLHHIVSDGWSTGVFNREFMVLYEAFHEGRANPLRLLEVQYADFALWQRQWLDGEMLERGVEYWKQQLADIPGQLALPTDRPRAVLQTFAAEMVSTQLSVEQLKAVKEFMRAQQATLYMTLLAAFAVLLERYSGQEDIVVGSPVANRPETQLEELIGFFVNSLVMRVHVQEQVSFRQLLKAVRSTTLEAYQYQDIPFERLVEKLSPERRLNMTPVFQVVFALQNAPMETQQLSGLEVTPVDGEELRVRFDVELHAVEGNGELKLLWVYNRDLFDGWRVEQMARHYVALLEAAMAEPEVPVQRLSILSQAERYQVLYEWNDTRGEIPEKCLPELFEEQVERRPEAVAVVDGEERLTYRELNQRANRLAHYLRSLGVGSEVRVAICMERSVGMVVAILGVLKAGGAYVPIDASYPAERLEWMLKDVQASILLTQSGVETQLAMYAGKIVRLDKNWKDIEGNSEDNPVNQVCGEDLAYVIYTSGSTGKPKGVAIQHRSLLNLIAWHIEKYQLTAADRTTQFASISFDAAVWEIWPALAVGASLWIVEKTARLNPVTLPQWLHAKEITLTFLPTGIAEEVMNVDWPAGSSLRHLLTGGDKLHRTFSSQPNTFLFTNHYGPTENTVVATASIVDNHGLLPGAPPIGKPIANTQIYIVDRHMEPVPVGVTGELYIAGMGLARGYLNRPEQTAERFVPNPYTQQRGERMYRTGDLGRWRPDGSIEYVGRNDWQVKVRGFRIEPGEIEAALQACPEVAQGVVVVREDIPGDKHLVGYVVAAQDKDVDGGVLRQRLLERLPEYMVPGAYVRLDKLPLTGNGKLDRKALPAPDEGAYRVRGYEAPVGEMEKTLAGIWAEVLRVERVGRHDNFFALGGHSLLAVRLVSRMQQTLGVELAIRALFEAPTVAEVADRLKGRFTKKGFDRVLPLRPSGNLPAVFCLPPGGGLSWSYAGLLQAVEVNRPMYGLEASDVEIARLPENIEATAEEYLAIMRRVQAQGPYHLLGWSFGGLVAHSVACQLQLQNQEVGLLAVLDAYPSSPSEQAIILNSESSRKQLLETVTKLLEPNSEYSEANPADRTAMIKAWHQAGLLGKFGPEDFEDVLHLFNYFMDLRRKFHPSRFYGNLLLFVAMNSIWPSSSDAWGSYIDGNILTYQMNCRHSEMGNAVEMAFIGRTITNYLKNER